MEPIAGHRAGAALRPRLLDIYRRLFDAFGPQRWWPAGTPFEVIVGAILTQSTAWSNVEKAIGNLKTAGALSPAALRAMPLDKLAALVRPSGYYNAKAAKVRAFVLYLARYQDDLARLFSQDDEALRAELLDIHGVGEETADSIALYAAGKATFVIDAYTRRIVDRLGMQPANSRYGDYRSLFQESLPRDAALFNEYHALMVRLGKDLCRKRRPLCARCPLLPLCPTGSGQLQPSPVEGHP